VLNYAQQARAFTVGSFHMPGLFVRGEDSLISADAGPATILFTGVDSENPVVMERPWSAGYAAGLTDYAGLNLRANDATHTALSTIASLENISWSLTSRSKYYLRPGGVSGIHESLANTFPSSLTLWGYGFKFNSYGLSYLDSLNVDSITDGTLSLEGPAKFTNNFETLTFSCLGDPVQAEVPAGEGFKMMDYWLADFKTHSIRFQTPPGCPATTGFLVLGIEGYASHFTNAFFGEIGFYPSGDQIPPSAGLGGVTSRLKSPSVLHFNGPSGTSYNFTPSQDIYYNAWSNAPAAGSGWLNIFGKLDMPFFEDMQIHLQTSCRTNGTAASTPINLSGGWTRTGTLTGNHGWLDGSSHSPFQTNLFDTRNAGWPYNVSSLTLSDYQNNSAEEYHPRAQRVWLGVVDFDYPLSWNSNLRTFKSLQQVTTNFLVLSVQHEVKYADPLRAELDFGAQYDGLPQVSIANMAFDALDSGTGVAKAMAEAAGAPVRDVLNQGLGELNQLLDAQLNQVLDGVLDRTVDPLIDRYFNQLSNTWASAMSAPSVAKGQQFLLGVQTNNLNFFVGTGPNPVAGNLCQVLGSIGNVAGSTSNLIGQIQVYLRDATNAINAVVGTLSVGTNGAPISAVNGLVAQQAGNIPVLPSFAKSLVGEIAAQYASALVGPLLTNAIEEIKPAVTEISGQLVQTRGLLMAVNTNLANGAEMSGEIQNTLNSYAYELTNLSVQVSLSVTQYFAQLNYSVDNPFVHVNAADFKSFVRQKIEEQLCATTASAKIQTMFRQRLYDVDAAFRTQLDSIFAELNGLLRNLISQSLAEVDNSINKCLGDVNEVMGAGKINGHALINGDSLKELRLDGQFQLKVPDDFELNAYLQIKELSSDGTASACYPSNAPATEVTLGATRVPVKWLSPDLTVDLETKFTFDGSVPFPVNMAGQLELNGNLEFETFTLHDMAVAVGMGKYENYLSIKGGVAMNGYDFSGGAFFGRTCSLAPLLLVEPEADKVLGNPPFTGAYCYAQGWLPVSEMVLGVPASCMFNVSAGVGAGAFYFMEGPTYGGKMFLGVSGELLCLVSIEGDVTMIGVKHGNDLRFNGHGHFEAEIGSCPFCVSVSKSVSISYINKAWHMD
jgi:hypothetical protein